MHKIIASFLLILTSLHFAAAQSVKVTPRKIIYKRSGKNIDEYKRKFEVRYPVITGKLSPSAKRSLLRGIDYWRVFDTSLKEERSGTWLSSLDYEVRYNRNNIFDIWLTIEGVGAYPDSSTRHLVFDLRNGKQLTISDLFERESMTQLLALIRKRMRHEEEKAVKNSEDIAEALRTQREMSPEFNPLPENLVFKNLDGFTISNSGLTFLYNYEFPHVIQALQPAGEFMFTWKQLRPYIKPGGLLGQFVR